MKDLNLLDPMKQIPMDSSLEAIFSSPISDAILFTSLFNIPPTGKMVWRRADCGTISEHQSLFIAERQTATFNNIQLPRPLDHFKSSPAKLCWERRTGPCPDQLLWKVSRPPLCYQGQRDAQACRQRSSERSVLLPMHPRQSRLFSPGIREKDDTLNHTFARAIIYYHFQQRRTWVISHNDHAQTFLH